MLTNLKSKNKYKGHRFVLTVHGQTQDDLQHLVAFFETSEVKLACISKEFGENKVHPHWQVYFELVNQTRMKTKMAEVLGHDNFHLEKAVNTANACVAYVFGVGKPYELGWIVYRKNVATPYNYKSSASEFWANFKPKKFQAEIIGLVSEEVHDREIIYLYETAGNTGKTKLAEYLHIFHGAIVTGGKTDDMKHAIARWQQITQQCPVIIVMDIARSERIKDSTFRGIESIKNGLFFSGKYESAMLHSVFKPHIFIFANFPPCKQHLSQDRWKIGEIAKDEIIWH